MPGYQVILFSLSLAFVWVEILKWGSVKPFTCTSCLTGWFALILAFSFGTPYWMVYLFVGKFIGCMYEAIKMRFL